MDRYDCISAKGIALRTSPMVALSTQQDFRRVQSLPFCYLCGKEFIEDEEWNRDHIPPQSVFAVLDREPLWLPTHVECNRAHHLTDEKIGQLIALRYGKYPRPGNYKLQISLAPTADKGAITNLHIEGAVWRWVLGFHAALYSGSAIGMRGAVQTPFHRADVVRGRFRLRNVAEQHEAFVSTIKNNRVRSNLDYIVANKGKLRYECVWGQDDKQKTWLCVFALNIYDWKDLGATDLLPPRGCVGFYQLPDGGVPANGAKNVKSRIIIPNYDRLDPFAP